MRAFLNVTVLSNFIHDIIMEAEIILLKIQFLFAKFHASIIPRPITREMKSIIRSGNDRRLINVFINFGTCRLKIS